MANITCITPPVALLQQNLKRIYPSGSLFQFLTSSCFKTSNLISPRLTPTPAQLHLPHYNTSAYIWTHDRLRSCVCRSLSISAPEDSQHIKRAPYSFLSVSERLESRGVSVALMEVLPDRISLFPDTSSCLTGQPFHLDTCRFHLNTTKCLKGGRGVCLKR